MRLQNGYVKLHRKATRLKDEHLGFFMKLVCLANISDTKADFNGQEITLKRGQLITGIQDLALLTANSTGSVRGKLKFLENRQMIQQATNNRGRKITICNYTKYQDGAEKLTSQLTSYEQTTNKQLTNSEQLIKKNKKNKEEQEEIAISLKSPPGNLVPVYCEAFKTRYKANPHITGKDAGMLNGLLKTMSFERASDLIQVYLQIDDPWFKKMYHSVPVFFGNLNQISVALNTGKKPGETNWDELWAEIQKEEKSDLRRIHRPS